MATLCCDNLLLGDSALMNYQINPLLSLRLIGPLLPFEILLTAFPLFCPLMKLLFPPLYLRSNTWGQDQIFLVTMSLRDPGYGLSFGRVSAFILMCSRRLCLSADSPALCLPHFTVNPGINCTNHHSTIFSIRTWTTFVLLMAPKTTNLF